MKVRIPTLNKPPTLGMPRVPHVPMAPSGPMPLKPKKMLEDQPMGMPPMPSLLEQHLMKRAMK